MLLNRALPKHPPSLITHEPLGAKRHCSPVYFSELLLGLRLNIIAVIIVIFKGKTNKGFPRR